MSDDNTIVDIFAARATPTSRQERPALHRARMAWAARKLGVDRLAIPPWQRQLLDALGVPTDGPLVQVGGVAVGDEVEIDYYDRRRRGVVLAWERPGEGDASSSIRFGQTVARIRVDLGESQGLSAPVIVRLPRFRIFPLNPES